MTSYQENLGKPVPEYQVIGDADKFPFSALSLSVEGHPARKNCTLVCWW